MQPETDEIIPPELSDDALAVEFTRRHANDLRYVSGWGQWYQWTGKVWIKDATLQTFDRARAVCRDAAASARNPSTASRVASAGTVSAVEKLARSDRAHAADVDCWDADPWALNTPAGLIDLRTGKARPARRDDHCTKITAAAPGGACPTWLRFLRQVTDGDADLIGFLKRMAGYSLTGSTRDHALFFSYGTGGNGKGVFLNTLTGVLGDYATIAPMETFVASPNDRHPTDLASLRGARMVTAQETEEGRRWAESRIKSLTGGDPITARFMRQDFFTFTPQFKLVIAGNHKPGLRNVDEAMRRRFHMIPFTVTIAAKDRDPDLPEKLKAEWPGILQWAIDGCLEWQHDGLKPPKAVIDATAEYLASEDSMAIWLDECCERRRGAWTSSGDLFRAWSAWAAAAGEAAGVQKRFGEALATRGFEPARRHGGVRGFNDIELIRRNSHPEDSRYAA